MSELHEELRRVTDRVPPTRVAEGVWETARGRVRRRRTASVGAAAAVVVVGFVAALAVVEIRQPSRPKGPSLFWPLLHRFMKLTSSL